MSNGQKVKLITFLFSLSPKEWKIKRMAYKYGNMHSLVKMHTENSVMKKCHAKGVTLLSFLASFSGIKFLLLVRLK